MKRVQGIGVSGGIAIGPLVLLNQGGTGARKETVEDVTAEFMRLDTARKETIRELDEIYHRSLKLVGDENSSIFQIHSMMLEDEDFLAEIREKIENERVNAEYAVWEIGKLFSERFAQMDDSYMQARKTDVIDISSRLIRVLERKSEESPAPFAAPSVVCAEDLMPSDTIQMDTARVLAFVTREGSMTSHAAILARTLQIPSVAGLGSGFSELTDGVTAVVDGFSGEIFLEPDEALLAEYRVKRDACARERESLRSMAGQKAVTRSGRSIELNANIGHPGDVDGALENSADGIGLFRSEFLYMEGTSFPTEEQQLQAYKTVLEKMGNKRVIIRTLDLGADKQIPYWNLPKEANPALGCRAIRICLKNEKIFRTQLRALLRASVFGNLSVMFPMIISIDEVRAAKKIVEQVKTELRAQGLPYSEHVPFGIMVETPAAALVSDSLAKEVDFFSIGTNDLTQYTLAADRMNSSIAELYDPRHPAVLWLIEMTVRSAKQAGIEVGICGESAADTGLTAFYLKIGVNELSVAPSRIPEIKKAIRELDL